MNMTGVIMSCWLIGFIKKSSCYVPLALKIGFRGLPRESMGLCCILNCLNHEP